MYVCVRESERDLLPNKETTTNFDAPKMSFECFKKRERRMITVGWFKQDLVAQGLQFLSTPDFCLLQTSHPLPAKWIKQSI